MAEELKCAALAEVASDGGIVVQPQDLALEGWALGDIDLVVVVGEAFN